MIVNHPEHVVLVSIAKIFSGANLYLSGEGTRQLVTPEILRRRTIVEEIKNGDEENARTILNTEKVAYLYFYGDAPQKFIKNKSFQVAFRNKEATIIRLNP